MLKLWGRPTSTCTMKALWTCAEAGQAFELVLASATMGPQGSVLRGGEPYGVVDTPAYRAMNPNGTVPTLADGSVVLWESNAIVRYLVRAYAPQLYGSDERVFARADQWVDWAACVDTPLHTLIMECSRLPDDQRNPAALRAACARMERPLAILSDRLAAQAYVVGQSFTFADIVLGTLIERWYTLDVPRPETPAVRAWRDRLAQRPAFQAHIAGADKHV